MTRAPHPDDVAGFLTEEEAAAAKEAVEQLDDRDRFDAARRAFESGNAGE